jgi:hypothetical protein
MTHALRVVRILAFVFVIAALLTLLAFHRSGAGENAFSDPSLSASEAKRLGVFLKPVTATMNRDAHIAHNWQLEEVWVEERVERYEAIPIRKAAAGARLCVRLTAGEGAERFFNISKLTAPDRPALESECTVRSKATVVIAFQAEGSDSLPPKGTISIYEENEVSRKDPGKEMITVEFEIPAPADPPAKAPGIEK